MIKDVVVKENTVHVSNACSIPKNYARVIEVMPLPPSTCAKNLTTRKEHFKTSN
jgi:hypothetical protein